MEGEGGEGKVSHVFLCMSEESKGGKMWEYFDKIQGKYPVEIFQIIFQFSFKMNNFYSLLGQTMVGKLH